ncbi:MAG: phosphoribosylformylglycinamidine cyclo-ligase [Clostridiales bacterium]|jgi:phosphoribosylformylglycinamidine cyclo-ligase|nr:phosphoribosylformylglycinamidine cyclo-ligase [Clostridiales bacterium]
MSRELYKESGVDVDAGYASVRLIKALAEKTARPETLGAIGGFGGLFSIAAAKNMEDPILVSGTDGVGTKLKIAFIMDRHDTIGTDCVAMCVNDVICCGAEPLFFLDYIACGRLAPDRIAAIVAGMVSGCRQAGAALIGGETAEMPGFYDPGEYDVAGFAVGLADRPNLITGGTIAPGDVLIGIASSGLHSNGYSLVRRVLRMTRESMDEYVQSLGQTLGEALLTPTRIYVKAVSALRSAVVVKGLCHITGGGFTENVPRMLPAGVRAVVRRSAWTPPPIFGLLAFAGDLDEDEMYSTFNMGVGMAAAVSPGDADAAVAALTAAGETAFIIGEITAGEGCGIC